MSVDGHRTNRSGSGPAERLQATPYDVGAGSDALMLKVAAGDHDAFEALYLALAPGVYGFALCMVGDRATAEDVTARVFAGLWMQAPAFDASRGTARNWAIGMTHRLALDAARQRSVLNAGASVATQPDVLRAASDQQRLAISLTCFSGLTPDEVSQALGLSAPTVRAQLRDGLRRMAAGPARAGGEPARGEGPLYGRSSSA